MSSTYDGLKFVFVVPDSNPSRRPKELAESEARSHAAVIGHRKKKAAGCKRIVVRANARIKPRRSRHDDDEMKNRIGKSEEVSIQPPLYTPSAICLGLLAPNTQAVHDVFRVSVFWNDLWLRCLSNETFCSAFFARVQACRDGHNAGRHVSLPSTDVLLRERGAILNLRRLFDKHANIDEHSLLAMMQLGLLERELGTSSHADSHMDAVSRVLQQKLQDKVENCRIRPMLTAFILTRAMELNFPRSATPPITTAPFHGPILKGQLAVIHASTFIDRLPPGFATLAKSGKLSIEVLQVLERITRLRAGDISQPSSSTYNNTSDNHNNTATTNTLSPNFWSACPSLTVSIPPNSEPDIDNLLALGLWLYVALEFSSRPVPESMLLWISMSRSTRQDLSTRLMRCVVPRRDDDEGGEVEEECLMWLFEIAVASWIGPNGALLPQGRMLLDFRRKRFGSDGDSDSDSRERRCKFGEFFEFSKRWCGMEV